MRLTIFSDYTLRVLVYLACHPNRFVTIQEIASAHAISANHLMKVAHQLGASGTVQTLRGPRGGLRLARPAELIRIGDVIRRTQPDHAPSPTGCATSPLLAKAAAAFMAVLDSHTLADLVQEAGAGTPLSNPENQSIGSGNSGAASATQPAVRDRPGSTRILDTNEHEERGTRASPGTQDEA